MRFFGALKEAMKKLTLSGSISAGFFTLLTLLGLVIEPFDSLGIAVSYIIPYITVPALVICAFSFLFKRKSSDVYYALPVKRSTLYLANMLAVLLWTLLSYLLPFLIMMANFNSSYDLSEFGEIYLGHLATCLYITGGTTVAIFLTGRVFSAIINSVIILVVPRSIYLIVCNGIFNRFDFLVKDAPGMPNLSTDSFITMGFLESERLNYIVVGIILIILGYVLFVKRKSETAEQSAPNRLLKIIYSSVVSFSLSLVAVNHYIQAYNSSISVSHTTALFFYGISVLTPFAYELITTKRFNLKYAFISLGALAGLNALMYASFFAGCTYVENQQIDIKGYRIISYHPISKQNETRQEIYLYTWGDYNDDSYAYNQILVNDYFVTNADYVETVKTKYEEAKKGSSYDTVEEPYTVVFLDDSGREYYRRIYLDDNDVKKLSKYATEYDLDFVNLTATMPAPDEIKSALCFNDSAFDKEVYKVFYDEMALLKPEERIALTYTVDRKCGIEFLETKGEIGRSITVSGIKNGTRYNSIYNIHPDFCPKTFRMIKERTYADNYGKIKERIKTAENDYSGLTVILEVMPEEGKYSGNIEPYTISVEKNAVNYVVKKGNGNITWNATDDEFINTSSYGETDYKKIQKFFDAISENLDSYKNDAAYNAKLTVLIRKGTANPQSALIEFNMSHEKFRELYGMLTYSTKEAEQ